jgi:glycerate 2-kinase
VSYRVLAAPDKFRGTLTAADAARAIAVGATRAGWDARELPLADGGEGTLAALGGPNRSSDVTGPLGESVEASWRLADGVAVIETAQASGLTLAGGPERNDPIRASSRGTGELIAAALQQGAGRIIVGVGGSASTDGGLGAIEALREHTPFPIEVQVACDVRTRFADAAAVYGPQKGATSGQVALLTARLHDLAARYRREFSVDVSALPYAGAAGGLAGGLAALGAELVLGFELISDAVGLDEELAQADLAVTGEGLFDATSLSGKVVGGVIRKAGEHGVPALIVAGDTDCCTSPPVPVISLVGLLGADRAWHHTEESIAALVAAALADEASSGLASNIRATKSR